MSVPLTMEDVYSCVITQMEAISVHVRKDLCLIEVILPVEVKKNTLKNK